MKDIIKFNQILIANYVNINQSYIFNNIKIAYLQKVSQNKKADIS